MSAQDRPPPLPDPLPSGEWLYKLGELVFGPIDGGTLAEKLQSGELPPTIQIAREGRPFTPLHEVTVFVKVAAKAQARQRVEGELREAARRERRRRIAKIALLVSVAILAAGGAAFGGLQAVRAGLFDRDLGALAQIEIEDSPPLVASLPPVGSDELEYLDEGGGARPRRAGARAPASTRARQEAITAPGFDQASIQAVVEQNRNRLHRCLREQVAREPGFRGEVPLSFTVGNQGRVVQLWLERRGYANGPLQRCMEEELGRWRFPTFEGERPTVSLSFRVGG